MMVVTNIVRTSFDVNGNSEVLGPAKLAPRYPGTVRNVLYLINGGCLGSAMSNKRRRERVK